MQTATIVEPIIYTAARLEGIANRYVFMPEGLSSFSVKMMGLLCKAGEMTPQEIVNRLGGTKSNISQRLDNLEKKGYLCRIYGRYGADRRKVAVALTDLGRQKVKEINKKLEKSKLTLEREFTVQEIQAHHDFFNRINKLIDSKQQQLSKYFTT